MRFVEWFILAGILGFASLAQGEPVGTGFTYTGVLMDQGAPANGEYDFVFQLWDAETDGTKVVPSITMENMLVTDGRISATLDFGTAAFNGEARWVGLRVRPGAGGSYTTLAPRQRVNTTPYALIASSVSLPFEGFDDTPNNEAFRVVTSGENAAAVEGAALNDALWGVVGQRTFAAPGSIGAAFLALEDNNFNDVKLGTLTHAGEFRGNVVVTEQFDTYLKQYGSPSDVPDPAVPIAYGTVRTAGSFASGTPNFTPVWNAGNAQYEIAILGENYFFERYCTVATANSPGIIATTDSLGGKLVVVLIDRATGGRVQGGFQFVTYRPFTQAITVPSASELGYTGDREMVEVIGTPEIKRPAGEPFPDHRALREVVTGTDGE